MNIIEMAEQAGLAFTTDGYPDIWQMYRETGKEEIERFAELVAAHEREECAKLCDEVDESRGDADECATEIRARSKA
jgi:hypothetical protein